MQVQEEGGSTSQPSLQAMRILKALDTHGPKALVWVIAAELLGVFEWIAASAPGICG